MKSILSRFAGPSPSSRGNVNDFMHSGKHEYAKRKSPCPKGQRLGNQNGISEAASAGAGADASSSFGFALPLTEKSVTTMETFS